MFREKGYCRYCGSKCLSLKIDKENPRISKCKKNDKIISKTTPNGGNIRSPIWCPKDK